MFSFVFILKWPIKQRLSYCGPKLLWGPLPGPFLHWPVNVTVGGAVDLRCNTTEVHPSLPCSADVITALQKATDTLPRKQNSEAHLGAVRAAWRPEIYDHVEFWDSCPFDCVMVLWTCISWVLCQSGDQTPTVNLPSFLPSPKEIMFILLIINFLY